MADLGQALKVLAKFYDKARLLHAPAWDALQNIPVDEAAMRFSMYRHVDGKWRFQ